MTAVSHCCNEPKFFFYVVQAITEHYVEIGTQMEGLRLIDIRFVNYNKTIKRKYFLGG